ncbi:MAG TPA: CBS domain-containing protein [Thermoanaerobaculia bacterium]|jgi:CBS domain-containing protein|nr:CBS domain-containing protein [Thermoanaerobaculia bacterium]
MKVRDIMTENPACITPETTARQAARLMEDNDVGSLPVVESDSTRRLVGVVTDRDLALRVLGRGESPEVPVREVMSSNVQSCRAEDSIDDVENAMSRHQVRRIPIVDADNCVVGMIAQADLARERKAVGAKDLGKVLEKISEPAGVR